MDYDSLINRITGFLKRIVFMRTDDYTVDTYIEKDIDGNLLLHDSVVGDAPLHALLNDRSLGRVQEQIIVSVDYDAGVSPAAGTTIYTQEDYDALGAPLKYMQDVIDILPINLDYKITANITGSVAYGKPGTTGGHAFIKAALMLPQWQHVKTNDVFNASINFVGAMEIVEESIAVTVSAEGVTRTAGVWTDDALLGYFVHITSGASSGKIVPVWKNDATFAYMSRLLTAFGAATINIVRPATTFVPRWSDGSAIHVGMYCYFKGISSIRLTFTNLAFGSVATYPWNYWNNLAGQTVLYQQCSFHGQRFIDTNDSLHNNSLARVYLQDVLVIALVGSSKGVIVGDGISSIDGSGITILGNTSALGFIMLGEYYGNATCRVANLFIRPTSAYAGALVYVANGALFYTASAAGPCRLQGDTNCTGIKSDQYRGGVPTFSNLSSLRINDCAVAFHINGSCASLEALLPSSGNTIGWKIEGSGRVVIKTPSQIAATTEFEIDGENFAYADIPANSSLEGINGSLVVVT
jgi:hypothetical protein